MCSTSAALPGAVHLILAHPYSLRKALIENVMAGGDSAARGLVVGMILGAHLGVGEIEDDWLLDMQATPLIRRLMNKSP